MGNENDELRYRFTAWIKLVAQRAKIDYIRKTKKRVTVISLYDNSIADKLVYELSETSSDDFDFEDNRLASIFASLPSNKKRILMLLFVQNLTSEEIAAELGCTVQHVYNLRSLALKELRKKMGDNYD